MTERFVVSEDRPAVSYGPAATQGDEWVLAVTTDEGDRVEFVLGETAMYDLWIETKNVPWPERDLETAEKDRLVRQVVHAANGADEEMLRNALEALGVRR